MHVKFIRKIMLRKFVLKIAKEGLLIIKEIIYDISSRTYKISKFCDPNKLWEVKFHYKLNSHFALV